MVYYLFYYDIQGRSESIEFYHGKLSVIQLSFISRSGHCRLAVLIARGPAPAYPLQKCRNLSQATQRHATWHFILANLYYLITST